jgi:hypothetical protein
MVAGPDGNPLFVKDLAKVEGMDVTDQEGDDARPVARIGAS